MWLEDRMREAARAARAETDAKIAARLRSKYGLDFADMKPLYHDEQGRWTVHVPPRGRTATNDGCRHFVHKTDGFHYAMDFHFADHEWSRKERLLDERYATLAALLHHPWRVAADDHERELRRKARASIADLVWHDLKGLALWLSHRRARAEHDRALESVIRLT
jgi:hypothetical protein